MNVRAFQYWMGRVGLLAALLLLSVPTAGRLVHVAAGSAHAAHGGIHAAHANHARPIDADSGHSTRSDRAPRPAPGDVDCDYCPLLTAVLASAPVAFTLAALPPARPSAVPRAAPRLPWLHPNGLGSRGPPALG